MGDQLRILRVVMVSLGVLLVMKAVEFTSGAGGSYASDPAPAAAAPKETPADDHKPAPPDHADTPAPAEAHAASAVRADTPATLPETASLPQADLSRAEVEVLQKLAARRAELEARVRELDLREKLLQASELRVTERINELKAIEANIQALLGQRDAAEEAQLASLVKVYESMKPKDAARIFEQLEMEVLLPVANRMKEAKIGAVLAAMDPAAAKKLTVNLARRLDRPSDAVSPEGAASPVPAVPGAG